MCTFDDSTAKVAASSVALSLAISPFCISVCDFSYTHGHAWDLGRFPISFLRDRHSTTSPATRRRFRNFYPFLGVSSASWECESLGTEEKQGIEDSGACSLAVSEKEYVCSSDCVQFFSSLPHRYTVPLSAPVSNHPRHHDPCGGAEIETINCQWR